MFLCLANACLLLAQARYVPIEDKTELRVNFTRYTTRDRFDRIITFYLSTTRSTSPLPVVLLIQGSGAQSIWIKKDGKVYGGLQNLLSSVGGEKVRVLAVEKPGVDFTYQPPQPGVAEGGPKAFLEEHTLERWTEANRAALLATRKLPGIKGGPELVMGHSEGGLVAACVAASTPGVTHVANMSGGGPSQLFDFTQIMPADEVYAEWAKVQADPMSTTKFLWGHPYRRWSTFCATSSVEQLTKFKGRIYAVQGSEDKNEPVQAFDVLVAELRARGKDLTAVRLAGADHGYSTDGGKTNGFAEQFGKILDWFLGTKL